VCLCVCVVVCVCVCVCFVCVLLRVYEVAGRRLAIVLRPGDMVIMGGACQRYMIHKTKWAGSCMDLTKIVDQRSYVFSRGLCPSDFSRIRFPEQAGTDAKVGEDALWRTVVTFRRCAMSFAMLGCHFKSVLLISCL